MSDSTARDQASYPTAVDDGAPIVTEHTIEIEAPRTVVWSVHVDVDGWVRWNADITASSAPAPLAPGVTFDWTSYGLAVPSTVYAVEAPHTIRWGGEASGITGVHQWWFEQAGPDRTHVTTRESWAGDPVTAVLEAARHALDHSLEVWLAALRDEAERRARLAPTAS